MSEGGGNVTDHEHDPQVYETVGDQLIEQVDLKSEEPGVQPGWISSLKIQGRVFFSKTQFAIPQKSANNGSYFCFSSSV